MKYYSCESGVSSTNTSDTSPLNGYNYYKVVAHNSFTKSFPSDYASVNYRTPINSTDNALANKLKIYPNPVKDELKIESGTLRIETIEIVDAARLL